MARLCLHSAAAVWFLAATALAQDPAEEEPPVPFEEETRFHVSAEVKAHYRWSQQDRFGLSFPFPPDFVPVGQDRVELRTVSAGSSFEVSVASLILDADLPRSITGRVRIDFVDLYNRNPTSTDQTVNVREAWVRFGRKFESLEPIPASHAYALFGKAPKFERQNLRRLESYGLVGTAFNRFEDLQLQVGGSLGAHLYFRGQISNGNPIFFRDPNALAGDNGTDPPPDPDPKRGSGFPILYHAEVEELEVDDRPEVGGGLGVRFVTPDFARAVDILGFYYRTKLSDAAPLRGTFYEGDLDLLDGAGGISLPIQGNDREEYGANVDVRWSDFGAFFQWVHEEAAALPRDGVELELGYTLVLGDPADPDDLFTLLQPAVRYSRLDNDFQAPPRFVAPSVTWDWEKWDLGVRVTIRRGLDLSLEYAFHDIKASRKIEHDEFLATLRFRF